MAVTVIGQSKTVARQVDCVGCGARLEYYRNDVMIRHSSCSDDTTHVITCASCKKDVHVRAWF